MFKLFLCSIFIISITAINIQSSTWTSKDQQILSQIQQSGWGSFILNFAELHLSTGGILEDLNDEIEQLVLNIFNSFLKVGQLEFELELNTHVFKRRTLYHHREVDRLEQEIQDKERELFNARDFFDNVLIPQRDRFQNQLEQLNENIAQNRKTLAEETHQREVDHAAFETLVAEHTEALSAIDEALGLMSQLSTPSLVQVKKIQKNLSIIEIALKRHSNVQTFVKALLEIAVEANFANQGAVQEIIFAFNNLRNSLVESLNTETADEAEAQTEYEQRIDQLENEHTEFQRQVLIKNAEIAANAEKIKATDELIDDLNDSLATLNGQLDAENDDYARATEIFNEVVEQYTKELNACHKALELLNQPRFQEYVKSNIGGF